VPFLGHPVSSCVIRLPTVCRIAHFSSHLLLSIFLLSFLLVIFSLFSLLFHFIFSSFPLPSLLFLGSGVLKIVLHFTFYLLISPTQNCLHCARISFNWCMTQYSNKKFDVLWSCCAWECGIMHE